MTRSTGAMRWSAGSSPSGSGKRFAETTDLSRPRKEGGAPYSLADGDRKLADRLRLLADGRLPPRGPQVLEADYVAPP